MGLMPLFRDIADAIREKDGTAGLIQALDFPARIRAIRISGNEIALRALRIAAPPKKRNYTYNRFRREAFDSSGLSLEAELSAFSNTLSLPIALEYVTFSPDGPLPAGTESVTISFCFGTQMVTAVQAVRLQYESPSWADVERAELTWRWFEDDGTTWAEFESK